MKLTSRGLTLIELMVVTAIIGVLALLVLPAYSSHVLKGKRVDARFALNELLQAQERFRANCPQYASGLGAAEACDGASAVLVHPGRSSQGLYDIAITAAGATSFTATATARSDGSQARDRDCRTLTLVMSAGSVTNAPAACW